MNSTRQLRYSAHARRQQIMEVAAGLFARQGFEGTTTRQIADRAHVNEAIIFRHFRNKEELYWAIIQEKIASSGEENWLKETLERGGDLREIFVNIALKMLDWRFRNQDLNRLLLYSALENHRLSHQFFRSFIAKFYESLAEFIRQCMEEGVLRSCDPLLAARGFIGMIAYHTLIQNLYGGKRVQKFRNEDVAQEFASLWLSGVLRQPGEYMVKARVLPDVMEESRNGRRNRIAEDGSKTVSKVQDKPREE